jgi:Ca2+-binding EF-hand superfamily protein
MLSLFVVILISSRRIIIVELLMDDNLQKALAMFKHYGCDQETLVSRQKLMEILNRQAADRLNTAFSMHILEEIWGQAETTSRGEATALTFSRIYAQAIAILEERVRMIDGPAGLQQKEENLII